jgi:hypothetical protein
MVRLLFGTAMAFMALSAVTTSLGAAMPDGPPVWGDVTLPELRVGVPVDVVISVDGAHETPAGAIDYSVVGGALPAGLEIDASSGRLRGTPDEAGVSEFIVLASNGHGATERRFAVVVSGRSASGGDVDAGLPVVPVVMVLGAFGAFVAAMLMVRRLE